MKRWLRPRNVGTLLLVLMGTAAVWTPPGSATDADLTRVRAQLLAFAETADRLSTLADVQRVVPLTGVDPAGPEGLGLSTRLQQIFDDIDANASTLDELRANLEKVEGTSPVNYRIGCAGGADGGANPASDCGPRVVAAYTGPSEAPTGLTLTIPVHADRTFSTRVGVSHDNFRLSDGTLDVTAALDMTLQFTADFAKLAVPATAGDGLAVTAGPVGTFAATLGTTPVTFNSTFGFTSVSGTAAVTPPSETVPASGVTAALTLVDPNGIGGATVNELVATDIRDVVTLTPAANLNATVTLDTPLNGTGTDLTATFTSPTAPPSISSTALDPFKNVTADGVFAGIAQLAGTLSSVQSAADVNIPFLQQGLASVAQAAQPFLDYVAANGVLCSTDNTGGSPTPYLPVVGLLVLCQATALKPSSDLTGERWAVVGGRPATEGAGNEVAQNNNGLAGGSSAEGTIGAGATERAAFVVTDPSTFRVTAHYTEGTAAKTSTQPPFTAQEMVQRLVQVAGVENTETAPVLRYDATSQALTFHLRRVVPTAPEVVARLDVGEKLAEIGLRGIGDNGGAAPGTNDAISGTATLRVVPGNVVLDITFGVLLAPSIGSVTVNPTSPRPSRPATEADRFFLQAPTSTPALSVDSLTATGAIDLHGQVGFLGVDVGGNGITLTKKTGTAPVLGAKLQNLGTITSGGTTLQNAVPFRNLDQIDLLGSNLDAGINLKMDADFDVSASAGGHTFGTAGLHVAVPDAALLASNPSDPNAVVITARSGMPTFDSIYAGFNAIDPNDPQAMFALISSLVDTLATAVLTAADEDLDKPLPLVGTSPRDLLEQVTDLKRTFSNISGAPAATISCGSGKETVAGKERPKGDPNALTGGFLYCQATNGKPVADGSAVTWTGGAVDPALTAAQLHETVGPDPSRVVRLSVAGSGLGGSSDDDDATTYAVQVEFTDADGEQSAALPSLAVPTSLQSLITVLTDKLNLPQGALTVEDRPVTKADGSSVRALVLNLDLGVCTSDRHDNSAFTGDRACAPTDRHLDAVKPVPLAFDLGTAGGVASLASSGNATLSYLARARLGLAIPLQASPAPLVLGSSRITLDGAATSNVVDLTANLGPFEARLGKGAISGDNGRGVLNLAARFDLDATDAADAGKAFPVDQILTKLSPSIAPSGGSASCPGAHRADADNSVYAPAVDAFGCVLLSASVGVVPEDGTPSQAAPTYVGDIRVALDDDLAPTFVVPPDLTTQLQRALLDPALLLRALRELVGRVQASLDGAGGAVKLPVVGDALDAGADVAGALNGLLGELQTPLDAVKQQTSAGAIRSSIRNALHAALTNSTGPNLLRKDATAADGGLADVVVNVLCGPTECPNSALPHEIQDVKVAVAIGQGAVGTTDTPGCTGACGTAGPNDLPFDIGLDGLPFRIQGALSPTFGWRLNLVAGVSRSVGPYIGTAPKQAPATATSPVVPEVVVNASVGLGAAAGACGPLAGTPAGPSFLTAYHGHDRCLDGTLAFLGVNVKDGNGPAGGDTAPSSIGIRAALDLTDASGDNRLSAQDFLTGNAGVGFRVSAGATLNLAFRTGVKTGETAALPSILGSFHFDANGTYDSASPSSGPALTASFKDLTLDVGTFVSDFLDPITSQVKNVTSPLKPVIDTLQAPVPVLTQLSELVGQPPVTLLSLIQAVSGQNLSLVESLLSLIQLVNNLPSSASGTFRYIGLGPGGAGGQFGIDESRARNGAIAPNDAESLIQDGTKVVSGASLINADRFPGSNAAPRVSGMSSHSGDTRPTTFGVKGLEFPFLTTPSSLFGLVLGKDVDIVKYDAGLLRAGAGTKINFGPFFIGPVPVTVFIGVDFVVKGRFVVGYDTSGLRKVMDGATGEHLLDGLYLDDGTPTDLPEITLVGTVTAGAKVDIVVASAGVEGGIQLTVDLNLNDAPSNDGKLRIEEIAQKLSNPICLFDVKGALDAFLRFFVEIHFVLFSERAEFEIVRVRLLDFNASCSALPPPPNLGDVEGGVLKLNIGPRTSLRGVAQDVTNEIITVRPLQNGGYELTGMGYTEVVEETFTRVEGDGGTGNDQISLLPGGTTGSEGAPSTELAFGKPALLYGGPGNDKIVGSNLANTIHGDGGAVAGDAGADVLTGGKAVDTMFGGADADTLEGGPSGDTLYGDSGTDATVSGDDRINGGGGGDAINGGPGNDLISGGPGTATGGAAEVEGGDTIVGGPGNDTISGVLGEDFVYGGVPKDKDVFVDPSTVRSIALIETTCTNPPAGNAGEQDKITGGDGDDRLVGGPGNDEITGDGGNDRVCGLAGADLLDGDGTDGAAATSLPASGGPAVVVDGNDTVDGGGGADRITGGALDDRLSGAGGNDRILGGDGHDKVLGGDGRDLLVAGAGKDVVVGDTGAISGSAITSSSTASQLAALVTPDPASNGTTGTAPTCAATQQSGVPGTGSGDCLFGGDGTDALFGEGAADFIQSDEGDDRAYGGFGPDRVFGGPHDDVLFGEAQDDVLQGDSGDDRLFGGTDQDTARGGMGDDHVVGESGADDLFGDAGQDDLIGGSETDGANDAGVTVDGAVRGDRIEGGDHTDFIAGDNATIEKVSPAEADTTTDTSLRRSVNLLQTGDVSTVSGPDRVFGGTHNDRIWGEGSDDVLEGGDGKDLVHGNGGSDTIEGQAGADHLIGGSDAGTAADAGDTVRGGPDDDVVLGDNGTLAWSSGAATMPTSTPAGSYGNDHLFGEDGNDRVYGQLGDDEVAGATGFDHLFGDMGTLTAPTEGPSTEVGGGPRYTARLVAPDSGGVDTISGGNHDDFAFAGAGGDTVAGGVGDDHLEGNGGQDRMFGLSSSALTATELLELGALAATRLASGDDDDILGGSSAVNPAELRLDEGETEVHGNLGADVILGDNGEIVREIDDGTWATDPVMGGPTRSTVLHDLDKTGPALAQVSGGDVLHGNEGNDKAFGQGGGDSIDGEAGNDVLVGNEDSDGVRGGTGEDDLVGGSLVAGRPDVGIGPEPTGPTATDDTLEGGADNDVLSGDNAVITRPLSGGVWQVDAQNSGHVRTVLLHDTERLDPAALSAVSGHDLMLGGDHRDRIFGQGGNDTGKGNADTDFLQGNQDDDLLEGNGGEDDLIGGSAASGQPDGGDVLHGGGDADVAIGDNGLVDRTDQSPEGGYTYTTYQIGISATRFVKLLDVDATDPAVAGSDQYSGGSGVDVGFGQGERDYLLGGHDDDYLEGNGGSDFVWGDADRAEVVASPPAQLAGGLPSLPTPLPQGESSDAGPSYELSGTPTADGQDDEIGGSSKPGLGDAGDFLYGNGRQDFQLGDNGTLRRDIVGDDYARYVDYNPDTVIRRVERFDVAGEPLTHGDDYVEGNTGDDYQWGQDGDDTLHGNEHNDDMYGELGTDTMLGHSGEDAMVGDRGSITDTLVKDTSRQVTASTGGPAFFDYTGLRPGQLDRRVDLLKDLDGGPLPHNGHDAGAGDIMRGGPDHDSMHGGFGNDLMNGDSGGDWLFGADGTDVMWGGKGSNDPLTPNDRGADDSLVDYLFGGVSLDDPATADKLDYRPRGNPARCDTVEADPCAWFDMTETRNDDALVPSTLSDNQHHGGIDWIYGGQGRDVLQGDVGKNGPDFGDRLMDWVGAWNLYTRCNASYGDDGDIRQHSPAMQRFLQALAYGSGAGGSIDDVTTPGTSAFRELALVYPGQKGNNGPAFPSTPGHFDQPSCSP